VVILAIALYLQMKQARQQAEEGQQLLADYQRLEGKNLLTMEKII
jgi:hypothetical protein